MTLHAGLLPTALMAASVVLSGAGAAQEFKCEVDDSRSLGRERVMDEGGPTYDKGFEARTDGGSLVEKRYCSETSSIPQVSELSAFGKRAGTFRHVDYWSGRELVLVDDAGNIRVIKTNVSNAFERVLIFDAKGAPIVPLAKSESSDRTFGPTLIILEQYAQGHLSDGIVLAWMTHYHGEGNGADMGVMFARWLLSNRVPALQFLAKLDRDTSNYFGSMIAFGIFESNGKAVDRFKSLYRKGDNMAIDVALPMLDGLAGDKPPN
jgi:hypothetical protein